MATWNKKKVNASDVNNGNQFNAGDGLRNTDINKIFESGLYSQDVVENIGIGTVTTGEPGSSAKASVTYDSTTGYPKINLTLPRGTAGPQGEPGSVGTIRKQVYSGTLIKNTSHNFSNSTNSNLFLISFGSGDSYILDNSRGARLRVVRSEMETQDRVGEYFLTLEISNNTIKMVELYLWTKSISGSTIVANNQSLSEIYNVKVYSLEI